MRADYLHFSFKIELLFNASMSKGWLWVWLWMLKRSQININDHEQISINQTSFRDTETMEHPLL